MEKRDNLHVLATNIAIEKIFVYDQKMKREKYNHLLLWKQSPTRKPLVLRGARQVGKTHLLKTFGSNEYEEVAYFNFERDIRLREFFKADLAPQTILEQLRIYSEKQLLPSKTLIIFDEIQECPKALNSLKYFYEEMPTMHVAAAGSLLGIQLAHEKGFPVGKVNFLDLYPLTFLEFLSAVGADSLCKFLAKIEEPVPIAEGFHQELLGYLRKYFFVGGMPEAVFSYSNSKDLSQVRQIHQDILDAYELDFAKHAAPSQIMKISEVWHSIPSQLARENKKFIFSAIRKSARAREYEAAIQWLVQAGIILRSSHISVPKIPLSGYENKEIFKIYLLDIGLLSTMSQLPAHAILEGHDLFTEFKGALTENFVAETLTSQNIDLFYWTSEGIAEVDFIIEFDTKILPLEVKSGTSQHKKSLRFYEQKFVPKIMIRTSLLNLKHDEKVLNIPLYLLEQIHALLKL